MIEVEVKAKVDDLNAIEELLLNKGYREESKVYESDTYYTSEFHDFKKLDEALRIRTIQDLYTNKKTSCITYKGAKIDQTTMTRKELETFIEDEIVMKEILTSIGFQPVPSVNKVRKTLKFEEIRVCLDDVENLGTFIEIEILVKSESEREKAILGIETILAFLRLSLKDTTRTSYLSMLMKI